MLPHPCELPLRDAELDQRLQGHEERENALIRESGGSRLFVIGAASVLVLGAAGVFSAVRTFRLNSTVIAPVSPPPLGSRLGDFPFEGVKEGSEPTARHVSGLAPGCKVLVFATTCPAVVETVHELSGVRTLQVRGETLPMYWVTEATSEEAVALLRDAAPDNTLLVSERVWRAMRPDFAPQFYILDAEGVLVARGWPDVGFLRDLPDEFQSDFEGRCISPAASPGGGGDADSHSIPE